VRLHSHSAECDFDLDDTDNIELTSRGSRTGFVYSDAGGGINPQGKYSISGAFRYSRKQELAVQSLPGTELGFPTTTDSLLG
jgi:hypothetical protein